MAANAKDITLYEELGVEIPTQQNSDKINLPVGERRYIEFISSKEKVLSLFANARLFE